MGNGRAISYRHALWPEILYGDPLAINQCSHGIKDSYKWNSVAMAKCLNALGCVGLI